jgi:DNA-binding MurR/RpiR family transcriptional regulator
MKENLQRYAAAVSDEAARDDLAGRIASRGAGLSAAERRAAAFFQDQLGQVAHFSAAEIATHLGVSEATVIRAAQGLGYRGFAELKRAARSSGVVEPDLRTRLLATLDAGAGAGSGVARMLEAHLASLDGLARIAVGGEVDQAVDVLARAERILVAGTGPSAALAAYGAVLFNRIGTESVALVHTGPSAADEIARIRRHDVAIVLAYGRVHRHVAVLMERCAELEVPVVLCTDTASPPVDVPTCIVLRAGRGAPGAYASHAATTLLLEGLAVSLAARAPERAGETLDRVNELRRRIGGRGLDIR